jgi:hypothetical protein
LGPKPEFFSGSEKEFETLGRSPRSMLLGLAGHVKSSCHSWSSYSEEYQRHIDVFSGHVILSSAAFQNKVLHNLNQRTGMTHGDVALNTLRIVVEGDNVVPYVLDIPEYPWIAHQRYFQNEELESGA